MKKGVIVVLVLCIMCCCMMFMLPSLVPNWVTDTLGENIGSHRKIKKNPSDCENDDLHLKFKNKHARCIHFGVHNKDESYHMDQSANHGCLNAEYHVCVPKDGYVSSKGTTHCGGRATLRSSRIYYDTLKTHDKPSQSLGWLDFFLGKTAKDVIPIRHKCKDSYPRYYLNGDKDQYWGNPAGKA